MLRGETVVTGEAAVVVPGESEKVRDEIHAQMPKGGRRESPCRHQDTLNSSFRRV